MTLTVPEGRVELLLPAEPLPADPLPIDRERAEQAVGELLRALGRDTEDPHLHDTPRRVVEGLQELLTPRGFRFTTFPNDDGYDEPVIVRGIPFASLCSHHLLPFRGIADVGYLPGDRLVGLSKLARVVEAHARALQVQERLTSQIADQVAQELDARAVGVVMRAEHMCMSLRGARVAGTMTVTSAFRGEFGADPTFRALFQAGEPAMGAFA